MALSLGQLAHRYDGQRAVILGNGPSLNRTPLHLLAGERVWASNRAYLLFDRIDWRPSHYVAVDPTAIANSTDRLSDCVATLPDTVFFFPEEARGLLRLGERPNVCWFRFSDAKGEFADGRTRFEVLRSATVAVVSMQLAALLGFANLLLTGCDMNYQHTTLGAGARAEKPGTFKFSGGTDADHFHPDYLQGGVEWTLPEVPRMLLDFQAIGQQFEEAGIDVANATIGGMLECFRRVDLPSALAGRS